MLEIVIRRLALRDLDGIATYTKSRWGNTQSRSYLTSLKRDIQSLGEYPLRYPLHPGFAGEVRKMLSGHHIVIYCIQDDRIEIVRVLHERMDVDGKLT
ncbi:MAG: type II toxin-antitoxin system RelE/ParE family toxin [Sphingomonadaceae bacterium]|nr:type II toxin-antitoxin system RelE/ParE family toxin [Sphingomonadaceae bacterium]